MRSRSHPYLIHGAGIKLGMEVDVERDVKRKEIGIPSNAFLVMSAGELNKNKNTALMVRALSYLKDINVHYIACGVGGEKENLVKLATKLGVKDRFHLLGYRTDIPELMSIADAFVMMSFREGLPRSIMEAMDMKLPCVGSDTRGVRDLIDIGKGGMICSPRKAKDFGHAIRTLYESPRTCQEYGMYNKEKVKMYSVDVVTKELYDIYREAFKQ